MTEDNIIIDSNKEPTIQNQKPLFTHEQRESVVRAFAEAWNTHRVWLEFPKSTRERSTDPVIDLLILSSITSLEPSEKTLEARKTLRKIIEDEIKIISGSVSATPEVIYKTINDLYNHIVELQGHNLIGGSFLTNEVENRIADKVVKRVDAHIEKIRNELGLDDI